MREDCIIFTDYFASIDATYRGVQHVLIEDIIPRRKEKLWQSLVSVSIYFAKCP